MAVPTMRPVKDALSLVALADDLDATVKRIQEETGEMPRRVSTSARAGARRVTFAEIREKVAATGQPLLFLFGTGWGLTEEVLDQAEYILEPIQGFTAYNHLSVRAVGAVLLDRLRGKNGKTEPVISFHPSERHSDED